MRKKMLVSLFLLLTCLNAHASMSTPVIQTNASLDWDSDDSISTFSYNNMTTDVFMSVSNPLKEENSYFPANTCRISAASTVSVYYDSNAEHDYKNIDWNPGGEDFSYYYQYNGRTGDIREDGGLPEAEALKQSGMLIVPMFFNDGDMEAISAGIDTSVSATVNPVHTPVPGAFSLLASGLAGLAGLAGIAGLVRLWRSK